MLSDFELAYLVVIINVKNSEMKNFQTYES